MSPQREMAPFHPPASHNCQDKWSWPAGTPGMSPPLPTLRQTQPPGITAAVRACHPFGAHRASSTPQVSFSLQLSFLLQLMSSSRVCVCVCVLRHVQLFAMPEIVARQAPLSMGFSRQEYWSGLPFPPAEDLPDPRIEQAFPANPALQAGSLPQSHQGSPNDLVIQVQPKVRQHRRSGVSADSVHAPGARGTSQRSDAATESREGLTRGRGRTLGRGEERSMEMTPLGS